MIQVWEFHNQNFHDFCQFLSISTVPSFANVHEWSQEQMKLKQKGETIFWSLFWWPNFDSSFFPFFLFFSLFFFFHDFGPPWISGPGPGPNWPCGKSGTGCISCIFVNKTHQVMVWSHVELHLPQQAQLHYICSELTLYMLTRSQGLNKVFWSAFISI